MTGWRELLKKKAVLISDGAWGTEFQNLGLAVGEVPELLNLERPDAVEGVARAYVEAGSDIILTNTFGASRWKLDRAGLADRTAELNRVGIGLSRRAAAGRALVFASVGPTGDLMDPLGERTREEFVECFAEQVAACAEAGADGILIESMADLGESAAAVEAARRVCTLPVVASMTFQKGARGYATMMGVTPAQGAEGLLEAGAEVVGANCGAGIDEVIEVIALMRAATNAPLWAKPNAGMPQLIGGKTIFRQEPRYMAGRVRDLVEAGANIIGGCCGSTPEHLRLIAQAARGLEDLARRVSGEVLAAL